MDEEEVYYELVRMISDKYGTKAAERADEAICSVAADIVDDEALRP